MIYQLSSLQQDSVSPLQSDGFSTGVSGSSRASLDIPGVSCWAPNSSESMRPLYYALRCQRSVSLLKSSRLCCTSLVGSAGSLVRTVEGHRWAGLKFCHTATCVMCRHIKYRKHRADLEGIMQDAAARGVGMAYAVLTMRIRPGLDVAESIRVLQRALAQTFTAHWRRQHGIIARVTSIEVVLSEKVEGFNVHANVVLFFNPGYDAAELSIFSDRLMVRYIEKVTALSLERSPEEPAQFFKVLDEASLGHVAAYVTKPTAWSPACELLLSGAKFDGGADLQGLAVLAFEHGGRYLIAYRTLQSALSGKRLYNKTPKLQTRLEVFPYIKELRVEELEPQLDPEHLGSFSLRFWQLVLVYGLATVILDIFDDGTSKALERSILLLMRASMCWGVTDDELEEMFELVFSSTAAQSCSLPPPALAS